jgi:hypothetical protein
MGNLHGRENLLRQLTSEADLNRRLAMLKFAAAAG